MLDMTKSLSEEELNRLAERSTRETFEAGTVIASEGDTATAVDIVIHGVVEASVTTSEGKRKVVEQLRSGEYFGLTSVFMDTASFLKFTASTNVTLIRIESEQLKEMLLDRSDLQKEFAAILKQRIDAAHDAQLAGSMQAKRLTMKDVLRLIEKWSL